MRLNIHFLEAEGALGPWHAALQTQADAVADRIAEIVSPKFGRHPVDVIIQYLPDETIPELGFGGSCFRRGLVTISLDPEASGFEDGLARGIFRRTLAHELHHAMRWDACGYGLSLGEAFVSEGFADVFSCTVTGVSVPPWANTSIYADWAAVLDQAERERDSHDYDHAAWFFGTGELPRWAGYTIGYHLARLYGQANPEAAARGMIDTSAAAVLTFWVALKANALADR
ncbi:DUF2268 domain-containing putative Zn-dependent protease [Sinorhizobium sp. RAC02]|uniref:DUF2268 domain-containing putative Zn-dependent protease n=1 Tax=Sinorhizobium sp. RAC02 TaxID=1842534 RepID=UPI00083DE831|nr:DUF2268 domain-containing putative Zn-dependent protease [Sinorhizobium sp. RAC02]AOF90121.1 hypothetical protein BSY16_1472 [Sinorhizobium sp. RAC02]